MSKSLATKSIAYRLIAAQHKFPSSRVDYVNGIFGTSVSSSYQKTGYFVWTFSDKSIIEYNILTDEFTDSDW